MRIALISASLLLTSFTYAATPLGGWYYNLFGGYANVPSNINVSGRSNVGYANGYDGGGSFGFQSNPMRYEGQLTYINAKVNKFKFDNISQTGLSGYNNAVLAMANIYYDFRGAKPTFQPYLGMGIGYGWVHAVLNSTGPFGSTNFSGSNSVFSYQAMTGLTFNFAENYALNLGYRYVITHKVRALGKIFQANLGNIGVVYRFDVARYK